MSTLDKFAKALELTRQNNVKTGNGRRTSLDVFVEVLSGESLTRQEIIARMSLSIAESKIKGFDFANPEHEKLFIDINRKAKNQAASAIANSNNNTALSFNEKYKDLLKITIATVGNDKRYSLVNKEDDSATEKFITKVVEETEETEETADVEEFEEEFESDESDEDFDDQEEA